MSKRPYKQKVEVMMPNPDGGEWWAPARVVHQFTDGTTDQITVQVRWKGNALWTLTVPADCVRDRV